jgi:hypothetical protein
MKLKYIGIVLFVIGFFPHLAIAFFSPGIGSNGIWDIFLGVISVATIAVLVLAALREKFIWGFVILQMLLIGLVLFQTFSDAKLYIGT